MLIAIDGPLASGKGTLARALAAHYDLPHLDTGSLYRAVAFIVKKGGYRQNNEAAALDAAKHLDLSKISDNELRTAEIGAGASVVAAMPMVRKALFDFQRKFASNAKGAVLDGRDIGTVICPNANFKFFVVADPQERAERRHKELLEKGEDISLDTLVEQIKERDTRDSTRKDAPLIMAKDAHLLDTSGKSIEEVVQLAIQIIDAKINK